MISGRETPNEKTVRLGMEAKIKDYFNAGDATTVDALLDAYPNKKPRPEISVEQAQHIAREGLERATAQFKEAA